MNRKKFRATEEQPMEPVGSIQHKKFIDSIVSNPVPPYQGTEDCQAQTRECLYEELSEAEAATIWWDKASLAGIGPKAMPLFDELADASLARVKSTYTHTHEEGRGSQYGDTMRMCQFLTVAAVEKELDANDPQRRLALFLAGMVDMKLERMRGGYRDDNLVDLIAYGAALAELMKRNKGL